MKVTWEVSDDYVGKSRPQYLEIPNEEINKCETEEEKQSLINEYVQNDFDQNISWEITNIDE